MKHLRAAAAICGFTLVGLSLCETGASAQTLASFAVLAGSTITNTGNSVINGNVGLSPGSAVTGFPPGIINGTLSVADGVAGQAKADLTALFNLLDSRPTTANLTGQDLGTVSSAIAPLQPGVYNFDSSAALNGALYLNTSDPNGIFVFKIGSTLTAGSASSVVLSDPANGRNVYFVVGSSATLGTTSAFQGQILALDSISLNNAASLNCGAALAQTGAVTLINNLITVCPLAIALAPGTYGTTLGLAANATGNERAVAAALDEVIAGGGTLAVAFQFLAALTPDQLAVALAELSGEAGTAVAPAGTQMMNSFLSQIFDSAFDDTGNGPANQTAAPATVRTLDYVDEQTPAPGPAAAFAPVRGSLQDSGRFDVWTAGYGSYSITDGDPSVGSHDLSATAFGLAAGYNRAVSAASTVGVAFGVGQTDFSLSDGFGGGSSTMLQASLYGRTNFGNVYVAGAAAYGYDDVSTERSALGDRFTAAFGANDIAARVEVGRRFDWLIPYAALQGQAFFTPAYGETAASGSPIFALNYAAQTTTDLRTELGVRIERQIALDNGMSLSLRGRAAWAHDIGSPPSATAAFESIPDQLFTVEGAGAAADSLLLSASAEVGFRNGISVAALFDSALAANAQIYSGTGRVSYRW